IDTAMAGHYSSVDLAGVSLGGMMLWPVFMLLTGTTMALTPISSQLRGAQRMRDVGHQIRQGLWICAGTSTVLVIYLSNISPIYEATGVDPEAARIASEYLAAVAWGAPAVVFYVALRHASEGLGKTVPPMLIAGSILPLNAFLNYAFIYGKFGFPELGGVGCGYATAIVFWVELGLMLAVVRLPYFRQTRLLDKFQWPHWPTISAILRVGLPIGFTVFLEMAVFSVVGILIARIGVAEVAANSVAGNINWATYVIPMSLGAAASIRVGFHVGANDYYAARATAATVYKFSIAYALVVSVLLVLARFHLISIFTNDQEVVEIAAVLLLFIAVYQLVDDSQAVTIGALRGYKDTQMPMYAGLIGYWFIAVPLGYALAEGLIWPGLAPGVYGYWTGLTVGLTLVALAVGWRLWQTSNDHQRIRKLAAIESAA
ncbi:MAG: MATE family efflux transporter, partial [Pseudomonadota bacterium]